MPKAGKAAPMPAPPAMKGKAAAQRAPAAAPAAAAKKVRKLKDKNAPKKPVSAFMMWSQQARPQVKAAHPDITFGELGKKMGELWAQLDQREKDVRADQDKQRYEREHSQYVNSPLYHQFQQAKKQGKGKAAKLIGAPKRPTTPFMIFAAQERNKIKEQNPSISFGDIGKKLGEKWNSMSPNEKKRFEDAAEADKKRYEREMKDFEKRRANAARGM